MESTYDLFELNPYGAETILFLQNRVYDMTADGLAPFVATSPAAMVLTM